jgi:ubiquinone/menaquinone biosynthesis C-methylase UbiE
LVLRDVLVRTVDRAERRFMMSLPPRENANQSELGVGPPRPPVPSGDDRTNPFDDRIVASAYEDWYSGAGQGADRLEKKLLQQLLSGFRGARSALEVGSGTGHFTRWLANRGFEVSGLDGSRAMLGEAMHQRTDSVILGDATALPFRAQGFDLVLFITALEFISDPLRGLCEAVRVARHGILVGALNRCSYLGLQKRRRHDPVWRYAHLFCPGELMRLIRHASGPRMQRIVWRTTLFPFPGVSALPIPWGGFIGLAAHLRSDHPGDQA